MIPVKMAQQMLDEICRLCRKLNPQHADCNWCQGTDACRETIKGATKDATEPAIRTQAQLIQEWGQERFARALAALANWFQQHGHGDPFSTREIEALQDANDDAFQIFSARALYLDSPPDWSTNVKIAIEDVLKWELYKEIVSSAIVDHAGTLANVPEKYRDCWMATAIEITRDHFIVHLGAWDADITP